MKNWILVFLSFFLILACQEKWTFTEVSSYENGQFSVLKGAPDVGSDYSVLYGFYENGVLKDITEYDGDKISGLDVDYYEDGGLRKIQEYTDGQPDGWSKVYYQSGELLQESHWDQGLQLDNRNYYPNGNLGQEDEFKYGRKTYATYYLPNGVKYLEGAYRYERRIGVWSYYDSLGKLIKTEDLGDPVGDRLKKAREQKQQ